MINKKLQDQIIHDYLIRGLNDILQFSELYNAALHYLPSNTSYELLLDAVVNAVTRLVEDGDAVVGPIKWKSNPWELVPLNLEGTCLRELLYSVYHELGSPPNLGGAIWLQLTASGLDSAEYLISPPKP